MNHSTGNRTKAQQKRFDDIKANGCILCLRLGVTTYAEIHHLLSGGIRRGHNYTIGLCPWHHRAQPFGDFMDSKTCRFHLGPSLAEGSKPFHERWGSDGELLIEQNELIGWREAA